MGLFDNSLVSKFIPSIFKPDSQGGGSLESDRWISAEQSGCGVKIYPSNPDRAPITLFFEILQASVDRSINEIDGSFSLVLTGTAPWDELIQPDDFVRIFMGDEISTTNISPGAYNFAANQRASQVNNTQRGDVVMMPIPNTGYSIAGTNEVSYGNAQRPSFSYLVMYERFVGKVDRVQRIEQPGSQAEGFQISYSVNGRSLGSILTDISLYYNEWISGLNALNVFWGTIPDLFTSPTEIVQQLLALVLTEVPLPQWQLPQSFVDDMKIDAIAKENKQLTDKLLKDFRDRISKSQQSNTFQTDNALARLNSIVQSRESSGETNPLSIISLRSFFETYGKSLNKSFLSSVTTGAFDLMKSLSNPAFNEFFFDLCPQGKIGGGSIEDSRCSPTFVMRQRPYDLTDGMLDLKLLPSRIGDQASKIDDFSRPSLKSGVSLVDLDNSAISVYGRVVTSNVDQFFQGLGSLPDFLQPNGRYKPTVKSYECGYSGHDRLNAYLCLGAYNRGQAVQSDRITAAQNGSLLIDRESIQRFGFRIMELSTPYIQPFDNQDSVTETIPTLIKNFTALLGNWYFMNPYMLNGRLVCKFLPNARLGIPVKYYATMPMAPSPYPLVELYYCQGVSDSFSVGQSITTTLTVTRGIRYTIGANKGVKTSDNYGLERAKSAFSGLV